MIMNNLEDIHDRNKETTSNKRHEYAPEGVNRLDNFIRIQAYIWGKWQMDIPLPIIIDILGAKNLICTVDIVKALMAAGKEDYHLFATEYISEKFGDPTNYLMLQELSVHKINNLSLNISVNK